MVLQNFGSVQLKKQQGQCTSAGAFIATNLPCDQIWRPVLCLKQNKGTRVHNGANQMPSIVNTWFQGASCWPIPGPATKPMQTDPKIYCLSLQFIPPCLVTKQGLRKNRLQQVPVLIIIKQLYKEWTKEDSLTQKRWMHSGKTQLFLGTRQVFLTKERNSINFWEVIFKNILSLTFQKHEAALH